jgi:hypothetical protein
MLPKATDALDLGNAGQVAGGGTPSPCGKHYDQTSQSLGFHPASGTAKVELSEPKGLFITGWAAL